MESEFSDSVSPSVRDEKDESPNIWSILLRKGQILESEFKNMLLPSVNGEVRLVRQDEEDESVVIRIYTPLLKEDAID